MTRPSSPGSSASTAIGWYPHAPPPRERAAVTTSGRPITPPRTPRTSGVVRWLDARAAALRQVHAPPDAAVHILFRLFGDGRRPRLELRGPTRQESRGQVPHGVALALT